MSKKKSEFKYEEAMTRIEAIIAAFDEGDLSIDEMEASFSEGMDLLQKCNERLERMETRVREWTRPDETDPGAVDDSDL